MGHDFDFIGHVTIRLAVGDFLWVTMRLSCTVMKVWRLKDNGVTTLTFQGHVTLSVGTVPGSRAVLRVGL